MDTTLRSCKPLLTLLAALLLTAATIDGCGGGGAGSSLGIGGNTGTLAVSLTDAPACGFDAVNVTVDRVRVNQSGTATENDSGWSEIVLNPARKINLLTLLNGVLDALGETTLPAGHYSQIRLVLVPNTAQTANSVVPSGTATEIALDTPSGVQSGIKLNGSFDVAAGQRTNIVLDFDACKSVVARGNGTYALVPVITVLTSTASGITGFVSGGLLGSNAAVSAQTNGAIVRATTPDPQTGAFTLANLAPGSYDVVFTANNHATAVITGVPVAATTVAVSTAGAPIDLPASLSRTVSGTIRLNPPAATVAAFVAAKQLFTNGTIVTVRAAAADLTSGAYSLVLPVGAPLLNAFGGGTLPIVPIVQPAIAGRYTIEANAAGYQTQSATTDISVLNPTQDFTLVP